MEARARCPFTFRAALAVLGLGRLLMERAVLAPRRERGMRQNHACKRVRMPCRDPLCAQGVGETLHSRGPAAKAAGSGVDGLGSDSRLSGYCWW